MNSRNKVLMQWKLWNLKRLQADTSSQSSFFVTLKGAENPCPRKEIQQIYSDVRTVTPGNRNRLSQVYEHRISRRVWLIDQLDEQIGIYLNYAGTITLHHAYKEYWGAKMAAGSQEFFCIITIFEEFTGMASQIPPWPSSNSYEDPALWVLALT